MIDKATFVHVAYIESKPEKMWEALTDADLSARYWGHSNLSDWQEGSPWEHRPTGGSGVVDVVGIVLEAPPPTRLVITFDGPDGQRPDGPSQVVFDIEPYQEIVRLAPTHRPGRSGGVRVDLQRLAGGVDQSEVAAGDRARAAAGTVGDARGVA